MKVQTKYDIRDIVTFHPFADKKYKPIPAMVSNISITIDRLGKTSVEYTCIPKDKEPWNVRETSILSARKPNKKVVR